MFAFAGRRHQLNPIVDEDDKNFLIEQLSKFIEEQARMKFQQQFHQRQHVPQEMVGPGFSFLMPTLTKAESNRQLSSPIEFAVPPFDPRYYEPSDDAVDEPEDVVSETLGERERADYKNKILIPPPMHVNDVGTTDKILHRGQNKLAAKAIQAQQDVVQKPMQMEFDNTTSLYMVALIAGLSCAFSTGVSVPARKFPLAAFLMLPLFSPTHTQLIALGIMYWTMYKKQKSGEKSNTTSGFFFCCYFGRLTIEFQANEHKSIPAPRLSIKFPPHIFHPPSSRFFRFIIQDPLRVIVNYS